MTMNCKVLASIITLLFITLEVQAQPQACTLSKAKLQYHMISGNVFTAGGSLSLREALDTHQLLVSWKLIHPPCMERVCIEFLGSSLDDHCISSPQSTMAVIEGLPCNINVRIRVKVVAVGFASRLLVGSVYIGGNPRARPKAAPTGVFARQMHKDPLRIEVGWEPLSCMKQNSAITGYFVEFGRTNTTELRSVFTTEKYVYSGISNVRHGLGSLSYGEEYWFRVAARNVNGQGPFTSIVTATPSTTDSDPPPRPSTTSLPPTRDQTTKQSPPTTTPPITTTQKPTKTTKKTTEAPLTTFQVPLTTTKESTTTKAPLSTTNVTTTTTNEASHSTTQEPLTTTKERKTSTAAPLPITKEPHVTTEDSITTTIVPIYTTQESLTTTKERKTSTAAPITTTKEAGVTTEDSITTTNIPLSTSQEPLPTTMEPATTTQAPALGPLSTSKEPLQGPLTTNHKITTTTEEPTTTTEAHFMTTKEPPTTIKESDITSQALFTSAQEPPATTKEPVSTTGAHLTTSQEPSTTTIQSLATTTNPVTTTKSRPKITTIPASKREHSNQSTSSPSIDSVSSTTSDSLPTTETEKPNARAKDPGSAANDTTMTVTTSLKTHEVWSTTTKERPSFEELGYQSKESNTIVAVSVLLVLITLITGILIVLIIIWMLWRHRAVWKTQKRVGSLNVLNTNFLEMNRESQLFEMPSQNIYEKIYDEIKPIEPRLTEYMKNISVQEGEEVNLRVSFTGIPRPTITWFFNGKRMPLESRNGWEHFSDGCIFIASAKEKHAGIYDFIVSNYAGIVEGCTTLEVMVKEKKRTEDRTSCLFVDSNPIKKRKFGEHVSAYHALNNSGFIEEYEFLPSGEEEKITVIGHKSGNRIRNRFRNILCYDDNRIVLDTIPGYLNCHHDYINASYIDGYIQTNKYIAVQAPMRATITDFWRLIWQEKVQNIAMLTNLMEGRQRKCELYWPESGSQVYGPFTVTLVEEQVFADYTIRTMHLVAAKPGDRPNLQKVTQFHFTSWPDHGVPKYAGPLLQFLRRIKALHKPKMGPLLVHCSGGIGRTGTLISIDIALAQAARESIIDIPAIVTKMRNDRMKMVQSPDQYAFIHDAVLEWLICGDTKISAGEMKRAMERLAQRDIQTEENGYDTQFKVLQQVSPYQKHIERETALKCPEKNRNSNYLPPDRWRVILKAQTIETTYIHASFVNAYKQRRGLIVAQAPMKSTTEDFWKMVYERECSVIVMLSNLTEKGKEVCYQYWPTVKADTRIDGVKHGTYSIFTLESKREDGYMMRTFGVTDNKNDHMRRVTQFHMTKWNDDGLCDNPAAIMKILDEMFLIQRRTGNKPIVIHGRDTISRCGIFCALVNCIECCKTESIVDVFQAVKALRIQKPGIIQTVEQYEFIHDLMLLFLNTFSQYSNFK